MLNNPMQFIGMLQQSHNPIGLLQQFFGQNPNFNKIMQIVQNKTPQQLERYVRNLYKGQNIDINSVATQYGFKI